ncbi:hypothetical protein SteCoe_8894 [Stentor coeruleus]|uniref:Uncharacterized protein n=1 Tax=Stentor coeruleus TaxID=5963 RepID=A0A1R2CJ81_9CILI|nr:hypothetical protein SteCoe_8894 [Stentor coeruleus]
MASRYENYQKFTCDDKDCGSWFDSECSCNPYLRLCNYHMYLHHSTSSCNTRSLKPVLYDHISKADSSEKILLDIKDDLISTGNSMILIILKQINEGVAIIETKRKEIDNWRKTSQDKSIDDILGSLKYLKIKERKTKRFLKSTKKIMSLTRKNNNEHKKELADVKEKYKNIEEMIKNEGMCMSDINEYVKSDIINKELEEEIIKLNKDKKEFEEKSRLEIQRILNEKTVEDNNWRIKEEQEKNRKNDEENLRQQLIENAKTLKTTLDEEKNKISKMENEKNLLKQEVDEQKNLINDCMKQREDLEKALKEVEKICENLRNQVEEEKNQKVLIEKLRNEEFQNYENEKNERLKIKEQKKK